MSTKMGLRLRFSCCSFFGQNLSVYFGIQFKLSCHVLFCHQKFWRKSRRVHNCTCQSDVSRKFNNPIFPACLAFVFLLMWHLFDKRGSSQKMPSVILRLESVAQSQLQGTTDILQQSSTGHRDTHHPNFTHLVTLISSSASFLTVGEPCTRRPLRLLFPLEVKVFKSPPKRGNQ